MGLRPADLVPSDMVSMSLGRLAAQRRRGVARLFRRQGMLPVPPTSSTTSASAYGCRTARCFDGVSKGRGTAVDRVNAPITFDEARLARATVLEGVALGYVFQRDVREDIEAGRLISVLKEWMPPAEELRILLSGTTQSFGGSQKFVELARELGAKARQ